MKFVVNSIILKGLKLSAKQQICCQIANNNSSSKQQKYISLDVKMVCQWI